MSGLRLHTDVEVADLLGLEVDALHELRVRHRWPCVKLGRFHVRFTDDQVRQIVAKHTDPGKPTKKTVDEQALRPLTGQTKASARAHARKRAAS